MAALFSPPKAPKVNTPTAEEIAKKEIQRTAARESAIRDSVLERAENPTGSQSLIQPGLWIPK
jgi:hypothetical protein